MGEAGAAGALGELVPGELLGEFRIAGMTKGGEDLLELLHRYRYGKGGGCFGGIGRKRAGECNRQHYRDGCDRGSHCRLRVHYSECATGAYFGRERLRIDALRCGQ